MYFYGRNNKNPIWKMTILRATIPLIIDSKKATFALSDLYISFISDNFVKNSVSFTFQYLFVQSKFAQLLTPF